MKSLCHTEWHGVLEAVFNNVGNECCKPLNSTYAIKCLCFETMSPIARA